MPEPTWSRDRDRDPQQPPPPNKRNSITERLIGSFNQARKDIPASIQRRASSTPRPAALPSSSSSSSGSPILRIREWVETCNNEHAGHCSAPDPADVDTWRPAYLIDTVERCLVRSKPSDRYAAMSYVWGTGLRRDGPESVAQLLRSNVDAFQLSLPEADVIPQTILDAIWLAKKLGIRHLWVDRLCIVQDDEKERMNHIEHMPFVYANAYLTIIAAHGDVTTGLLSLNPRRSHRGSRSGSGSREHDELLVASAWNTRAWTLQELLYSRRAVFFFEDTITWECHCDSWIGSPTSALKTLRGNRPEPCGGRLGDAAYGFQHSPWPDLDEFARIVMDFSARRLTFVDDTLKAFSGITRTLSRVFPGGFMYGMPLMFLDIAMLWRPQASIRRRAVARPPFLPSWSWMGWWFDGVSVDLTLWRAAADYVGQTQPMKRGQNSKRFQPLHLFRIKPMVKWNLTDRSSTVPVPNTGLQYRELRSRRNAKSTLPEGWSRSGSRFKHDSDDETVFKYPIPVEDPPDEGDYDPPTGEMAFPGPLLQFKTTVGIFDVDFAATMSPKDRANPTITVGNIWSRSRLWVGEFRAHDGWLGVQSSNYDGAEKLEFIAISTAMERKGSYIFDGDKFEEHMDEDGIIDIVNVLWIERIGGVSYRRGVGHVLLKGWEAQAKDVIDVLLG